MFRGLGSFPFNVPQRASFPSCPTCPIWKSEIPILYPERRYVYDHHAYLPHETQDVKGTSLGEFPRLAVFFVVSCLTSSCLEIELRSHILILIPFYLEKILLLMNVLIRILRLGCHSLLFSPPTTSPFVVAFSRLHASHFTMGRAVKNLARNVTGKRISSRLVSHYFSCFNLLKSSHQQNGFCLPASPSARSSCSLLKSRLTGNRIFAVSSLGMDCNRNLVSLWPCTILPYAIAGISRSPS